MDVLHTVLDTIRDHVLTVHVVNKVRLIAEVCSNLKEARPNVVTNTGLREILRRSNSYLLTVLDECLKKLFVVYVMFGFSSGIALLLLMWIHYSTKSR